MSECGCVSAASEGGCVFVVCGRERGQWYKGKGLGLYIYILSRELDDSAQPERDQVGLVRICKLFS